ncbi:hypothetical protein [Absidia glauca]|uniref:BZIP domain-containing protein n=1 Tax=Absidia glauca TaxID=4829 RepID=A0A168KVD5_ABSGL|nr:hypothetical protein [Absidia glauca]
MDSTYIAKAGHVRAVPDHLTVELDYVSITPGRVIRTPIVCASDFWHGSACGKLHAWDLLTNWRGFKKIQHYMMALSDQYEDSFSDDDSQDDSYSDYSSKAKTTRKRASTTNKKSGKTNGTSTPKRPGRKPIERSMDEELSGGDPKLKRKAQNRLAQRNFRERKERHVSELQERIRQLEEEKSTKEADLESENAKLKEELDKLRQENSSLKDAKFTFEYPRQDTTHNGSLNDSDKGRSFSTTPRPLDSPPLSSAAEESNSSSDHHHQTLSMSSSFPLHPPIDINSSSSSGSEHNSPSSNSKYDNGGAQISGTTQNDNASTFSNVMPSASFELLNDLETNYVDVFPPTSNPNDSDLFHGKMDFSFTTYRTPATSADDWLLRENTTFPVLFNMDNANQQQQQQQQYQPQPASSNNSSLPMGQPSFYNTDTSMNTHFDSIYNPIYTPLNSYTPYQQPRPTMYMDPALTPSKARVLQTVQLARQQGKTRLQVKDAIQSSCPEYDVNILCGELRRMTVCYDSSQPFSDSDLAIVTNCVKQH